MLIPEFRSTEIVYTVNVGEKNLIKFLLISILKEEESIQKSLNLQYIIIDHRNNCIENLATFYIHGVYSSPLDPTYRILFQCLTHTCMVKVVLSSSSLKFVT